MHWSDLAHSLPPQLERNHKRVYRLRDEYALQLKQEQVNNAMFTIGYVLPRCASRMVDEILSSRDKVGEGAKDIAGLSGDSI